MTSFSSAWSIPRRLWLTTLGLVLAALVGGAAVFFAGEAAFAPIRATSPVLYVDGDPTDALGADVLGLRVVERIQQELEMAVVLAVWLPILGAVGVGLLVAVLAACRRLVDQAGRRPCAPENAKPNLDRNRAPRPPYRKAMTWLLKRSKPMSVTR